MRQTCTMTVSLPKEMVEEFEAVRKAEHRTRSELVREALRNYFAFRGRFPVVAHRKQISMPMNEAGGLTHAAHVWPRTDWYMTRKLVVTSPAAKKLARIPERDLRRLSQIFSALLAENNCIARLIQAIISAGGAENVYP